MRLHQSARSTNVSLLSLVFILAITLIPSAVHATPIFVESFDNGNLPGGQSVGSQFQSGLPISANGSLVGWSDSGNSGTIHAVDLSGGSQTDFAVMIWSGTSVSDAIELNVGIAANDAGVSYGVNFETSAAVYKDGSQTTTNSDSMLIEILRSDNSTLASYKSFPGAWTGTMSFKDDGFSYIGDGSGAVRIRVSSADPGSNIFAGAINNLEVSEVPEPSSIVIFGVAAIAIVTCGVGRRRSPKRT